MQLKFDTISPYNICADRLGITKTCNHWVATIADWKTCTINLKKNGLQTHPGLLLVFFFCQDLSYMGHSHEQIP